jgi:N-acetylmuramoyl-L-alanine amidase
VRRIGRLVAGALALTQLGVTRPEGLGDVVEVRHWSYPDFTRVVVQVDRPVESEVRHLAADPAAGRPERLYLDLEGVWVGRRFEGGLPVGDGLLRAVRLGQNTLSRTRVVIDVERYARHRLLTLSHPDRLVVDVYGRRPGAEALEGQPPGPGRQGRLPLGFRPAHTVVLDPGHGGRDPGAVGVGGLREKDVTLNLARALRPPLQAAGFRVLLTRDADLTLSLEERTARAEAGGGDLFVSLHANAAPRRGVQGIETYYLDDNHERHSLTVAARENGIPRSELDALQRALARLRISETSVHAERLATLVHGGIVGGMPPRYRPVQDLGVKKGPFYVLFLSDMPAILVEAGFLTNRTEAARLRDPRYLEAVAEQIAAALVQYREAPQVASAWGQR